MMTNLELVKQSQTLLQSLDQVALQNQIDQIQKELNHPNIWENTEKATSLNRKLTELQNRYRQIQDLVDNLENLKIAQELGDLEQIEIITKAIQKQFDQLQQAEHLQGRFDSRKAILSVHAGAGGVDAQDFAAMLLSMYQAFCKHQGWTYHIIHISAGEEGGLKSCTVEIDGPFAYGLLKEEAGVHRLVRLSPFNSGKTRETSFGLVEVLPDGLHSEIEINIDEKDLKWEFSMSSGKGGQSVNTTYSAVRVVHLPTGVSATCQNERSQTQNKHMALHYLKNKLAAIELQKQKDIMQEIKGEFQSAEWGSQIRSYILHPYKLVKDHRSNWESSDPLKILEEGDLLPVIWSVKKVKN
jgi:peptide chain release factor 2